MLLVALQALVQLDAVLFERGDLARDEVALALGQRDRAVQRFAALIRIRLRLIRRLQHTPLVVLAGKEYGSGSSRDWAAKGPYLLGIKFVIAESYERIHRSNLIGMGILPLQFKPGESADLLGLTGEEVYAVTGLADALAKNSKTITVSATDGEGAVKTFQAIVRIDTPQEVQYYQHGGILQYVLRQLLAGK